MEHFRGTAGSMIKTIKVLFAFSFKKKKEITFFIKKRGYSSSSQGASSSSPPLPPIRISCHLALVMSS